MNTVSSRFWAIPARNSRLHISRSSGTCVTTWCLPVGLLVWSLGPFCDKKEVGWLFFGSRCSTTAMCESGSRERPFSERLKPLWNLMRPGFLVIWHLEIAIGRPTPSRGRQVFEVLWQWPQLARGSPTCTLSIFHLFSTMETFLVPFTGVAHVFE